MKMFISLVFPDHPFPPRTSFMLPTLLELLIVSLSLLYINYVNSITHRRNIPGPFMAKLTTLWLVRVTWQRKRHLHDIELHQKYGRIVRVGPKQISLDGPSAVKMVYGMLSE
jgi:hypothetical protein